MYNELIINEKKISNKFLMSEQIFEDRFDDNDYLLIKKIFEKKNIIEKIYEIIDIIIDEEKIEKECRFLIILDFLFSMGSFDIKDPANIILKASRIDYINRIMVRAEINTVLGYKYYDYIKIHKKLLIGLRKEGILERNIIKIKKIEWETTIYLKLVIEDVNLEDYINVGTSKYPFIISHNNRYCIGTFRNIWKLKRKRKEMEDFKVCTLSVIKSNQIKFKLEKEIYDINKEIINEEKCRLINEAKCNSLEEYFEKVKIVLKDKSYNLNIMNEKREYDVLRLFQKTMSIKIIEKEIFNKVFYIPCFIDNRGRQYYGTVISPTFYVIFRYLYAFEEKKNFINLEESIFYKKIIRYSYMVKDFNLNEKETYIVIILLMEIGKFYIKTEEKYFVKTEEIIKKGLENYYKNDRLGIEDTLYINKIKMNLRKIINNENIDLNTIIFKDATASGLQNFGIILGYKWDKLKYLNLDGDDWCDTYKYIIEKFLNEKSLAKRKYWKSTIMTIPYNAVWYSCFTKFIEELRKDNIDYKKMNDEDKDKIKIIHKEMFFKMKNNLKEEFFIKKEGKLIEFKYNEWVVVEKKEYKINFRKERDKYMNTTYVIIEDRKATERAMEANNMHYLDSMLVKKMMEEIEIIPIHDCFGVRLCELHLLMDNINKYYSKIIGKETYSIHIIK